MSLLDQVRKLEQQVIDRLKELEPLTREYEQLRKLAERLGLKYTPSSAGAEADEQPEPAVRAGTRARATGRSGRAAPRTRTTRSPDGSRAAKAPAAPRRSTSRTRATGSVQTAAAGSKARKRRAVGTGGRRRPGVARPGQRNDDVLRLVRENPGITVREIGERLGVDATGLYLVVKRLSDDGRLRKQGTGLFPADSATASAPELQAAPASATAGAAATSEAGGPAKPQPPTADNSSPEQT